MPAQPMTRPSSIAVTGAAGFVGSAVCARFSRDPGLRGVPIVRGGGSTVPGARVAGDLLLADPAMLVEGCDAVVHCAARVHVTARETGPEADAAYRAMNVELPLRLATAARVAGARHFIQISSVAALTSRTDAGALASDTTEPCPSTPYGRSKLAADVALAALQTPDFTVCSLRPPAVFGPGVAAHFAALLRVARKGVPLPLGAISSRRSFIFVDNLADAVASALQARLSGAYIVTDSVPLSTADLYRRLLRLYGHGDRVFALPPALLEPMLGLFLGSRAESLTGSAAYDGSRFTEATGWRPPIDFDDALLRTVRADA